MKAIKCKHCGETIAHINGPVRELKCGKCGRIRKMYYKHPSPTIRLTMRH